ncbi:MAG TPA: hypothetical protein VIY48_17605 [Candidatus Paceibacterota bacterium]
MPKETFYPPKEIQETAGKYGMQPTRLEVTWNKDFAVNIRTATLDESAPKPDDEYFTSDDGSQVVKPVWTGMFVDLDRQTINDLIRVLRRARDQAFGRDE